MKFIVKRPFQCNRKEINMFYTLLIKLGLSSSFFIKKIKKCYALGLCIHNNQIIGISSLKHPQKTRISKISSLAHITFPKHIYEYGYVYVCPKYRGLGISKQLYMLLRRKTSTPLYATVKSNNIPMQKLLCKFGFISSGKPFINPSTKNQIHVYIQQFKKNFVPKK